MNSITDNYVNKKTWYETWFNTDYYHLLYRHRDHKEAEHMLNGLIPILSLPPEAKLIDLGCGQGRHACHLQKMGYDVTGIDLCVANILHARQFENKKLRFDVYDMHHPYREQKFDAALNLFTSFGYDENDEANYAVINAAAKNLKLNGLFVLDYLNTELPQYKTIPQPYSLDVANINFSINTTYGDDFISKQIEVRDGDAIHYFQEKIRRYSSSALTDFFKRAGLAVEFIYGDYDFQVYKPVVSGRIIIVGKKTSDYE